MVEATKEVNQQTKLRMAVMRHGESELVKQRDLNRQLIKGDPEKALIES